MSGAPTCPNLSNHANQSIIETLIDLAITKLFQNRKNHVERPRNPRKYAELKGSHEYVGSIRTELNAYSKFEVVFVKFSKRVMVHWVNLLGGQQRGHPKTGWRRTVLITVNNAV